MTEAQEKMLKDLDKKVDSIIETLGGNNLGTKGLGNELKDLHHHFYLHVEDNNKHFANFYKYKNFATGAMYTLGGLWAIAVAFLVKYLTK